MGLFTVFYIKSVEICQNKPSNHHRGFFEKVNIWLPDK